MAHNDSRSLAKLLNGSSTGYIPRRFKLYEHPLQHPSEVAEIILKVEREGLQMIHEVVERSSRHPYDEIGAQMETDHLWATVEFGVVIRGLQVRSCAAWLQIFRKRDENKVVEITIPRPIAPEDAKKFSRWIKRLADFGLGHLEDTGKLPILTLGRKKSRKTHFRDIVSRVIGEVFRRDGSADRLLKKTGKATKGSSSVKSH